MYLVVLVIHPTPGRANGPNRQSHLTVRLATFPTSSILDAHMKSLKLRCPIQLIPIPPLVEVFDALVASKVRE
jgi:hypothetical protein